ncbi:MAG: L,D-transpeptidase [Anaerolineaceae bacterium]
MRKIIAVSAAALILVLFGLVQPAHAEGEDLTPAQKFNGEVICLPDSYLDSTDGCELYGPAAYFADLTKEGITYPAPPLTTVKPSPVLNKIPYQYVQGNKLLTPYYSSIGDADVRVPSGSLAAKTIFFSYKSTQETERGYYYQSNVYGFWVDGGDVGRAAVPEFQGLQFRSTPRTTFAWVVSPSLLKPRLTPGYAGKETKRELQRLEVVPVYAVRKVAEENWVMIGLDEWIEDTAVARVTPNTTPPAGVANGRWIEVNLEEQVMMVYDQSQLVFATIVSTGIDPFFTRPGLHKIIEKKDKETMSGNFDGGASGYYLEDVPWTMYFDQLRALHGAYWNTLLGYPRSHGCVNLSIGDSRWLYDWAKTGDYVYVWDPSGKTPTDPAFYTAGGA